MKTILLSLIILASNFGPGLSAETVSLAGKWRFDLDRNDTGIKDAWFTGKLTGAINLPGSLTAQGIGDDITTNTPWMGSLFSKAWYIQPKYAPYRTPGNVKVPFWLQPDKYYAGAAWFQRDIEIPPGWTGRRVVLFLERAHWETRVYLDGQLIGTNQSLYTPHEYDLGQIIPGKHTLTIRVDNRQIVDIGENSHGISDHTQGNWNGIAGKIELRSTPLVWIENLQVYPDVVTRSVSVHGKLGNASGKAGTGEIAFSLDGKTVGKVPVSWTANLSEADFQSDIKLGDKTPLWDEFHPAVQHLVAQLGDGMRAVDFGLRDIATDGTQFTINGRKTFFRGTLECCIFPKTGHPPTEVAEWKRIMEVAKSYGLNLLRFHSYCPPEAAFQAADELGMYLQIETCWANQSTTIGDGKPVDQWVYAETDRILKAYGNHPSFVLMPYGNEPGGKNEKAYLAKYVKHFEAQDSRRLWTSGSGWPELAENQFDVLPGPRIQQWNQGLKSRINAYPPETTTDYRDFISKRPVPVISHEIGQWCVYPDFDETSKYTGYLKPKNFDIFRDQLEANGLGSLAKKFLLASGKLQVLCYKEEIESALRTPGMGGFELLDLHDFPGQGTALVGVLDPFWGDKGYVTAKEYSRFCGPTVPLARLKKRVYSTDEMLTAEIEAAHFGAEPMKQAVAGWKLVTDDGKILDSGWLVPQDIPVNNGTSLGSVSIDLKAAKAPAHYRLVVSLGGTKFANDWDVWVYPAMASAPSNDILVTSEWNAEAQQRLREGGKVLLTLPGKQVRNYEQDPVKIGFSSIFWNTAWTDRQAPTTLGILCDPKSAALAEFPTEFHSNWQWWYLMHNAGALRLDDWPKSSPPLVRIIDDWVTARPLGLIVEAKAGAGKIIVCGFDLTQNLDGDAVSRQMRQSLLDYMNSKNFNPAVTVTENQISGLIARPKIR